MAHIFTHEHPTDGKIGIGRLPPDTTLLMDRIVKEYTPLIPDKKATTHHIWFEDMPSSLRQSVHSFQTLPLWQGLGPDNAHIESLSEMDELYYSNPTQVTGHNLYGASGNFQVHRDCIFDFHGIYVYRILISLTPGNTNTVTYFNHHQVGHKLNKGDYIVFDFDRTAHQVIKESGEPQSRILLKLHFLVIDPSSKSVWKDRPRYLHWLYTQYEYITRYVMDTGTDPHTLYEFFWGVFCQWYCSPYFGYGILILTGAILFLVRGVMGIPFRYRYRSVYLASLLGGWTVFFLSGVLWYWGRYQLWGVK